MTSFSSHVVSVHGRRVFALLSLKLKLQAGETPQCLKVLIRIKTPYK